MTDFDKFAGSYRQLHAKNIRVSGESTSYFAEYKVKTLARRSQRKYSSILDFGCGIGALEQFLPQQYPGSKITGIDTSEQSLLEAAGRKYYNCSFVRTDGDNIPFTNCYFDLVILANSLHHIKNDKRPQAVNEIWRVLKNGGDIIVFEHNPLNPLTVKAVNTCEFDVGVELLPRGEVKRLLIENGFNVLESDYIVFFPHVLRFLRPLEPKLGFLPFGAQYYVFGRKII